MQSYQIHSLKSAIKNKTDAILRLSWNLIGDSDNKVNFLHDLLLTNRQVANLCAAFENNLSTDIKLSKNQIFKMIQSGGFLGRLLRPLIKSGLQLIRNMIKLFTKIVLIPLWLTAAASAADAGIHKKLLGSGRPNNTILIISNDEIKDIIKTVKSIEDSGLLLKGVSETAQNEAKEQKGAFLSMLLVGLSASLLGIFLAAKGVIAKSVKGKRWGQERLRSSY